LKEKPSLDGRDRLHAGSHHGVERRLDFLERARVECLKDQSELVCGSSHDFNKDRRGRVI
jgi:hypothetical protein